MKFQNLDWQRKVWCIWLSCTFMHLVIARPNSGFLLEDRATNCKGGFDSPYSDTCWGELGLGDWLKSWAKNMPKCGDSDDGSNCCGFNGNVHEPWTTCFLRLATGRADYDCTKISKQGCDLAQFNLKNSTPEYRYIVRNIYAMNSFFFDWYAATQYATLQANAIIAPIISNVDPEKKTNMVLQDILTALTAGLALLGAPPIAKIIDEAAQGALRVASNIASIAVQQAPGVAKAIWPSGTVNSQIIQIGNLETELANVNTRTGQALGAGLFRAMTDVDDFVGMASKGHFSSASLPGIPAQTDSLAIGYKTFILTKAMANNYWRASWENLPANGFGGWPGDRYHADNGAAKCNPDASGVCVDTCDCDNKGYVDWAGWVSSSTRRGWTLDQSNHKNNPSTSKMTTLIRDKQWADFGMMLDGGYDCTVKAQSTDGSKPPVKFNADGSVDFTCVSQLPIMRGCSGCPVAPTNGQQCAFVRWDGC